MLAAVATTFLDDKYYESAQERMDRVVRLVHQILDDGDYLFVWNLYHIVRTQWNLRSISHVLGGELVGSKHRSNYPKDIVVDMLQSAWVRPDDMAETFAYWYNNVNGSLSPKQKDNNSGSKGKGGLPSILKTAMQERFNRLTMFQAAKYPMDGQQFSLRNLLRISRTVPKDDVQSKIFKSIVDRDLPATEMNWKSKLQALITQGVSKKLAFEQVIEKMGLFAVMNNLNAFHEAGVDPQLAIDRLTNKEAVQHSRILPFRFVTAIEQVSYTPYRDALKIALEFSFANLELPKGKNYLIAIDTSGSMSGRPVQIASTFGAVVAKRAELYPGNKVKVVAFSTHLKEVDTYDMGVFALKERIIDTNVGVGTNGQLVYKYANHQQKSMKSDGGSYWDSSSHEGLEPISGERTAKDIHFDYIFVFTDMQYHNMFSDEPPKDSITVFYDLAGYKNTQNSFDPQRKIIQLSGFSEKIFDYLNVIENPLGMVSIVNEYEYNQK